MNVTFVTCVNDMQKYMRCVFMSLLKRKDGDPKGEPYLPEYISLNAVKNLNNALSSPQALNHGIESSNSDVIVCCHQDVIFDDGWVENLEDCIREIGSESPNWGVLGTFGVSSLGRFVGNVNDPHQNPPTPGLPIMCQSLDEHCLILRKSTPLRFDEALGGHHWYGTDICLQAKMSGRPCFAIDNRLTHLSPGRPDRSFFDIGLKLRNKWFNNGLVKQVHSTCGIIELDSKFSEN